MSEAKKQMNDEAKKPEAGATGEAWTAVHVTARAAAGEAVEYGLMEMASRGTQTRDVSAPQKHSGEVRVTAYFDSAPSLDSVRGALAESLRIYGRSVDDILELETSEEMKRDWLAEWKRGWQPVMVAEAFVIAPSWSEVHAAPGVHIIRIEPGMAFGTGTHETTRLCLAALAHTSFETKSVLDVGTGTGILAIAAAKRFPHVHIEACDTDADAITIARENAERNGVLDRIEFRVGSVEDATASADLVLANLTADVILSLVPLLVRLTCGRLVLSGILDTQADAVRNCLRESGVQRTETHADGEWVALIA